MKQLTFIPIIIILSAICQSFFPWWSIALVSFGVCYFINVNKFMAFSGSLLAILILWSTKAWMSSQFFDTPMSEILGALLGNISTTSVIFLTGLVGGVVAGLSGLSGNLVKSIIRVK